VHRAANKRLEDEHIEQAMEVFHRGNPISRISIYKDNPSVCAPVPFSRLFEQHDSAAINAEVTLDSGAD
jgi:hypothetical protein